MRFLSEQIVNFRVYVCILFSLKDDPHLFVEDAFVSLASLVAIVLMGINVQFKK
jgi:hypothetical protein